MSMRKLGGTLSREIARTGIAVVAVAAVILIYQGCSQPVEPVAQNADTPGTVNAQESATETAEDTVGTEQAPMEALPETAETAQEEPTTMAQAEEGQEPPMEEAQPAEQTAGMASELEMPTRAIAVIQPTEGNDVSGIVTFTQQDDGVLVEADLTGLEPGQHGFHIHQYGDISAPDGTSAGGHFDPREMPHGAPSDEKRHMGDLGNIEAGEDGNATYSRVDETVKLHYIIGRAVVVHAGEDDLTSQPTGDAGGRVGIGVIGIAQSENG